MMMTVIFQASPMMKKRDKTKFTTFTNMKTVSMLISTIKKRARTKFDINMKIRAPSKMIMIATLNWRLSVETMVTTHPWMATSRMQMSWTLRG